MLKRIRTFGKNARNWLKEGIQLGELKNVSNDDQKMLEERIFFSVGERLTKYFRMRILWVPGMFIAFVVVIFFLGLESWVKSTVEDIVKQEAGASLDRLVWEFDSTVQIQKTRVNYYNNQFDVIMRQYESLLLGSTQTVRDIYDPTSDIKQMYDSLKQNEGMKLVLEKIGYIRKFEAYLFKRDKVNLIFQIPTPLFLEKRKELNTVGFFVGIPIPDSTSLPPILSADAMFNNIDQAASDIQKLASVIFGHDSLFTMEMSIIRK